MAVESSSCRAVTFWEVSSIRGYYIFEEKAKANIIDRIYYIWQKGERLVRTRFRARRPGGATFTP